MFSFFLATEQREQGEQQEFPPHFYWQNSYLVKQLPQFFSANHVFCSGVSFLASVLVAQVLAHAGASSDAGSCRCWLMQVLAQVLVHAGFGSGTSSCTCGLGAASSRCWHMQVLLTHALAKVLAQVLAQVLAHGDAGSGADSCAG
jgi:hypothetical protein